jgi:hypothetical protein
MVQLARLKSVERNSDTLQATLTTLEAQYEKLEISHRETRLLLREAQNERGEFEMHWQDANKALKNLENETTRAFERKLAAVEGELQVREVKWRQEREKLEESRRLAVYTRFYKSYIYLVARSIAVFKTHSVTLLLFMDDFRK